MHQDRRHTRQIYKWFERGQTSDCRSRDGDQYFQVIPLCVQENAISRQDVGIQTIRNGGEFAIILNDQVLNKFEHVNLPRMSRAGRCRGLPRPRRLYQALYRGTRWLARERAGEADPERFQESSCFSSWQCAR